MLASLRSLKSALGAAALISVLGCGGNSGDKIPPIILSVSLSNTTVDVPQGGTVYVPVTIDAPTETATFAMTGLPPGVAQSYKESESNPSGLLTLTASTSSPLGAYMPTITVGSSGQTASLVFTLVVTAPAKGGSSKNADSPAP